ncbi:MAG: hypothetical protein AAB328_13220, partial [candidate division NC10 bacterium]
MDLYETAGFYVSHVTLWRHQVARQLNGPRGACSGSAACGPMTRCRGPALPISAGRGTSAI